MRRPNISIRRGAVVFALLLILVGAIVATRREPASSSSGRPASLRPEEHPGTKRRAAQDGASSPSAKWWDRSERPRRATHEPEKLAEFHLQEVSIDGLTFREALALVRKHYLESCAATAETPLALHFEVPELELPQNIHLELGGIDVESAVLLLGKLAGLEMEREGVIYRFRRPDPLDGPYSRSFRLSPDILGRLRALGNDPGLGNVRSFFARAGRPLDAPTYVQFFPASSTMLIRSERSEDMLALEGVAEWNQRSLDRVRMEATLVTLPPGSAWRLETSGAPSQQALDALFGDLAAQPGSESFSFPPLTFDSATGGRGPGPVRGRSATELSGDAPPLTRAAASPPHGLRRAIRFEYAGNPAPDLPTHPISVSFEQRDGGVHLSEHLNPDGSRSVLAISAEHTGP